MKGADLLKFLLALVVVWIHTGDSDLHGLVNWAVPIFFVLSGFFLWGKIFAEDTMEGRTGVIRKWWDKTLRLYLTWTLIYLPFAVIGFAREGMPFLKAVTVWLRNVLLVGENYLSWPLWYLLGMLWAGGIIWATQRLRLPFWSVCLLGILLYAVPFVVRLEDVDLYAKTFSKARNGLFLGFPYMVLGGAIRRCFPGIRGWSKDSRWYRPALLLRYMSIHIYLTHMLWAGGMMLSAHACRGVLLWSLTCLAAIITGAALLPLPAAQKFLYGRSYRVAECP